MNYCSIDDAWGKKPNMFNKYMNKSEDNVEKPVIKNDTIYQDKTHYIPKIDHFKNISKNIECENMLYHLKNCKECQFHFRKYMTPKIIDEFQNIVNDNKDIIVLILVGISILLFFNLINNITKNN